MQLSTTVGIALFGIGVSLVIVSNFILYMIVGEVNARSPADRQISMFFLQTKMGEIYRRHQELFPESRKRRQVYIVAIVGMVIGFVGFLVAISPSFVPSR